MSVPVSGPADLIDRVALVTGAARGIGLAVARVLARAGADVGLVDVAPLDDAVAAVEAEKRRAYPLPVDLRDRAAVAATVERFVQERGRVDVLVNNAGIVSVTPLAELGDEEWDTVLAVNLTATVALTKAVWPSMVARGSGKVICIGSRAARVGGNNAGPAYVASKGAVHAFVVSAAKEGARHGILVNGIAPGPVKTPMTELPSYADESAATPIGRMGRPEDIAEAVLFLASPASNFVTGTVLNVSGGALMG